MGLPGPGRLARLAAGTALHVAATGVGLAAGTAALAGSLVAPPVRQARATAGAVAESAVYTATVLAKAGARAAGAVITGVDDATDGNLERLTEAGKAMFEPPMPGAAAACGSPAGGRTWSWRRPRSRAARRCAGRCAASWSASTASSGPR